MTELFPFPGFLYRLDYTDSGNPKLCWFECEDHLVKHIDRHKLTKKDHGAKIQTPRGTKLTRDPLSTKPARKRKTTPQKPSDTKGSKVSKTQKSITKGKKVETPTPSRRKAKKSVFSTVEDFFTK
ncbi:hypothetical protein Syn7803US36_79 [Synechococcus phage ACG-2014f]|uniref:Uncharacterized protein n=1 Tax=Synechococcus phage ACG-2014f TaxID=1493511 RepID=A0A0E3HI16_9CAUD|nr:hypothetical protein Syn7803US36_79 [Synechococcus phage ACG-2014f]